MAGVHELTPTLGTSAACRAMGLWRGALADTRHAHIAPPLSGLRQRQDQPGRAQRWL